MASTTFTFALCVKCADELEKSDLKHEVMALAFNSIACEKEAEDKGVR